MKSTVDRTPKTLIYIFLAFSLLVVANNSNIIAVLAKITEEDISYGGTIIEAVTEDAQLFNPIISSDSSSKKIEGLIFEGMITYDKDMRLVPLLAKSWEVSLDGLEYRFNLREDVYWHDGEQFTADDVIFTWDRILDPETDTTLHSMFQSLDIDNEPYEKIGDFVVEFHLTSSDPSMLENMVIPIIPEHAYANHAGSDGIPHTDDDCRDKDGYYTFNDDPRNTAWEGKKPLGTGPMMYHEWEVGYHISLIRNSKENGGPGYWNEHDAYLDGYTLRVVPDINVQLLMLQHGNISLMNLVSTPPHDIHCLIENSAFKVYKYPTYTSNHFAFQCDPHKGDLRGETTRNFDTDPNHFAGFAWQAEQYPELNITGHLVRQALNYGLNKTKVIEASSPLGYRNLGPMYLAQVKWYNDQVNPYIYNATKANQLLGQAGFGYTPDDPKRTKLDFVLSFNQGSWRQKLCVNASDQWAKLGITVEIEMIEWIYMLSTHYDNRNFDMMSAGWTGGGEDPDLSSVWHSTNIRSNSHPVAVGSNGEWIWSNKGNSGGLNYMSYWNPVADEAMESAKEVIDPILRKEQYDYIQEVIVDDSPYIWLECHANAVAVDSDFHGFVSDSIAGIWSEPVGFHNIYYQQPDSVSESRGQTIGFGLFAVFIEWLQAITTGLTSANLVLSLIFGVEVGIIVLLTNVLRKKPKSR